MMASIASDNPVERIRHNLVGLRMPRALEALGGVIQQLERGQLGAIEAIDILLAEELTVREGRRIKAALQMARLATIKTLSGFDFSFQPSLDRNRIMALASLDFVDKHEVVHFIGQSGTGKSHLAVALGVEAIRAGRSVYFCPLADIVEPTGSPGIDSLAKADPGGTFARADPLSLPHPAADHRRDRLTSPWVPPLGTCSFSWSTPATSAAP